MPTGDLSAPLRCLREQDVQFIVVGGLAAVLNGAPIHTYDLDIVFSLEPDNIDRIMTTLQKLGAVYRIQPERRLRPTRDHVAAGGHMNLLTRFGPLDLLGTIGRDLGYSDLLPKSNEMDLGDGMRVRVLNLETIIAVKEQLGGEKDVAVLPILRRTLAEIRQRQKA